MAASGAGLLFKTGLRQRRPLLWDAALSIVAPTYSVQATLALLCLGASWFLSRASDWQILFGWAAGVTGGLAAYFLLGVARTEAPLRALAGIALIPAFLPWRMAIEVLGLMGYGRKQWVRTSRLSTGR